MALRLKKRDILDYCARNKGFDEVVCGWWREWCGGRASRTR